LGANDLASFGQQELISSGGEFYNRSKTSYGKKTKESFPGKSILYNAEDYEAKNFEKTKDNAWL